jgi:putative thioredoxin
MFSRLLIRTRVVRVPVIGRCFANAAASGASAPAAGKAPAGPPTTVEVPRSVKRTPVASSSNKAAESATDLPLTGLVATVANLKSIVDASKDVATLLVAVSSAVPTSLQLVTVLERLALQPALKEKIRVVRFDVKQDPRMAQALQIQNVPTTLAMVDGKTVDAFEMVPPPAELEAFLKRLAGSVRGTGAAAATDDAIVDALSKVSSALDGPARDPNGAKQLLSELLNQGLPLTEEQQFLAMALLLRTCVALGEIEEAREIDRAVNGKERVYAFVLRARKTFELASMPDIADAAGAAPSPLVAQCNAVIAKWRSGEHEPAAHDALKLVAQDKKWNDGATKRLALLVCDTLTPEQALPLRRKLQNMLFM